MAGMKPSPDRLELATYPSRVEVPARFSDVDMFRHLNNVAIGQFYEEVRFALTAQAREALPKGAGGRIMVVNVDIAYLREGRYPGVVTVGSGLVQKGRKSYVIGQALFQDGVCFSAADTTLVYTENGAPAALPPALEAALDALKLATFAEGGAAG
jgi:acyl-CoA thioester hydrolase